MSIRDQCRTGTGRREAQVVHDIRLTAGHVQHIANSAAQQRAAFEQINTSLGELDSVIQRNAATAEQLDTMVRLFREHTQTLQSSVSEFRLDS